MTTATKADSLAAKMVNVMAAVERIAKTGRNTAQGYDFVTDADVLDALRRAFVTEGIATVTSVTAIETVPYKTGNDKPQFLVTVKGDVTLVSGSESYVVYGVGQGADSGDKGVYKAITGMVKYALLKTFLIPTGDDPEQDEKPASKPSGQSAASKGAATEGAQAGGLSKGQKAMLAIKFKEAGLEGGQRAAFIADACGKFSSTQMDNADLDKVLAALQDADLVKKAQDEVKPE